MVNQFTIDYYLTLLSRYKTLPVKGYRDHENGVIVRHDVDFSLDMAYTFSRYELEYGIRSTYYLLLTSDLYNPFSKESKRKIDEMIKDGFEIGLHFDPTIYDDIDEKKLIECMDREIDMFEQFFGAKVYSYSMHNPSLSGTFIENRKLINAYSQDIFSDECYISDSCFSFKGKDPEEFLNRSDKQLVQFLTHPVHFFSDGKCTYEEQVNLIVNAYYQKLDSVWCVNNVYRTTKENYPVVIKK